MGCTSRGAARPLVGRWRGAGAELAGEAAKLLPGGIGENAEAGALVAGFRSGRQSAEGLGDIGGQRIEADLQFDDSGGRTRRGGRMVDLLA